MRNSPSIFAFAIGAFAAVALTVVSPGVALIAVAAGAAVAIVLGQPETPPRK